MLYLEICLVGQNLVSLHLTILGIGTVMVIMSYLKDNSLILTDTIGSGIVND